MSNDKPVILCIDDDDDVLDFLRIVLEAEGYEFRGAASAEEGIRAYREQPPDMLIVDLMMEEVDAGTGLVKELQRLGNTAPVVLLSSVGDNFSQTTDYSEIGLAGVFQKPLAKEHLLALLRAKLG